MSVLILGPTEERLIHDAVEAARANPVPWSVMKAIASGGEKTTLLLGDRKVGVDEVRMKFKPQNVMLGTYRCAISFEEQPLGMLRHLSVSTQRGRIPGIEVMQMVLPAFGFSGIPLARPGRVWNEEFEPGWFAINVAEVEE